MKSFLFLLLLAGNLFAALPGAYERRFVKFDANDNGVIDPLEWLQTQGRATPVVMSRHRFNWADADKNGVIDRVEFLASRGGKLGGKPNKIETFNLADADEDGYLDPEEYSDTIKRTSSWVKVLGSFSRKDRNDDDQLNHYEFGIRNPAFLDWNWTSRR